MTALTPHASAVLPVHNGANVYVRNTVGICTDTDNGAKNSMGVGCDCDYDVTCPMASITPAMDDDDFTASVMCCAHGGGSTAVPYVPPALISPICAQEVLLDFEGACSRTLQNNMGGQGPDTGAEELRFGNVGVYNGRPFDAVLKTVGSSYVKGNGDNGCGASGKFGKLVMRRSQEVSFHLTFRDSLSDRLVTLPAFRLSFLDIDAGSNNAWKEQLSVRDYYEYTLDEDTHLTKSDLWFASTPAYSPASFSADNPTDPQALTETQRKLAVSFVFLSPPEQVSFSLRSGRPTDANNNNGWQGAFFFTGSTSMVAPCPLSSNNNHNNNDLRAKLAMYCADQAATEAVYGPIGGWDVSAVTDMSNLISTFDDSPCRSTFNADVSSWDTSSVTTMRHMFHGASAFNQPLSFDTSSVRAMGDMFSSASAFNQPLSFDTSSVTHMSSMFANTRAFNQPLSFDTSSVTTMEFMFGDTRAFNQPLSLNTSSVINMVNMFYYATAFNQPLSLDTSSVMRMGEMFQGASAFNQPLSLDTSSVTEMKSMFEVCAQRVPCAQPPVGPSPASSLRRPTSSHLPARMSPFFLCFPFDSAASVGVQPAAELRHVQRHKHAIRVSGALYACLASSPHSRGPSQHAACAATATPHTRLPARMPPLFLCTPLDSAGRVAVQPAAEPRHVQRRNHALHVSGLLRACPATNQPPHLGPPSTLLATPPLLYRYSTATPPLLYALPPPDPHAAPLPMHSFLDRTRRRSTSR